MWPESPGNPGEGTNWSTVRAAGDDASAIRKPALAKILTQYHPVLNAHLVVKKGMDPGEAGDIVQGFIQEKVLEKDLIKAAEPSKGRFRTFLLTSFDRYVIDCWRKKSREPSRIEPTSPPSMEPAPDVFDLAWAMQVLVETVHRMQAECARKKRLDLWRIFEGRTLAVLQGRSPVSYELLAAQHSLNSAKQAANRYVIAETMFRRNFQKTLEEYAEGDLEGEAREFRKIFSLAGAELVEELRIKLWNSIPELTMPTSDRKRLDLELLARMPNLPTEAAEPGEALRHFLATPVALDLSVLEHDSSQKIRAWAESEGLILKSFGDLFGHPHPLVDLLDLVKDFAKEHRTDSESPVPKEVATVLYYASIAAALSRCGKRISRHDDEALRHGFRWGLDQSWIDESIRTLLCEGLERLGES